jgi:phosphoenolpyruvate-protein kinase (PTS system EI component)
LSIQLHGNIGCEHEADLIAKHCLEGIGLFRTEYLFLGESEAPSPEYHRKIYGDVAARPQGQPLVIRTSDIMRMRKARPTCRP